MPLPTLTSIWAVCRISANSLLLWTRTRRHSPVNFYKSPGPSALIRQKYLRVRSLSLRLRDVSARSHSASMSYFHTCHELRTTTHENRELNPYYSWFRLYADFLPHRISFPPAFSASGIDSSAIPTCTGNEPISRGSVQSTAHHVKSSSVPQTDRGDSVICFIWCLVALTSLVLALFLKKIAPVVSWELIVLSRVWFPFSSYRVPQLSWSRYVCLTTYVFIIGIYLISTPLTITLICKLCQMNEGPNYVRFLILRDVSMFFWVVLKSPAELHLFDSWRHLWDLSSWWSSFSNFPLWRTISSCFIAASGCCSWWMEQPQALARRVYRDCCGRQRSSV